MDESLRFPQYRKLSNDRSWYAILSSDEMEEIQVVGSYFFRHHLRATILPERVLIHDLIDNVSGQFDVVTEKEYLNFIAACEKNLEGR